MDEPLGSAANRVANWRYSQSPIGWTNEHVLKLVCRASLKKVSSLSGWTGVACVSTNRMLWRATWKVRLGRKRPSVNQGHRCMREQAVSVTMQPAA